MTAPRSARTETLLRARAGREAPDPRGGNPQGNPGRTSKAYATPPPRFFETSRRTSDVTERRLRAVKTGEKAPAKRGPRKAAPKSVVDAARSGDRRQLLVALQYRIAKAVDDPKTAGPAFAALIRQQRDIAAEIAAIDLAADAGSSRASSKSVIATTPDERWDESMI